MNPFIDAITDEKMREHLADLPREDTALMGELFHAAMKLGNADQNHATPSPSSIDQCRLQLWFNASGTPRSNPIPPQSFKKMETGTAIEQFWRDIYEEAGFTVLETPESHPHGNFRGGKGDGLLVIREQRIADALRLPIGTLGLLELKDLGLFSFMDYCLNGIHSPQIDKYFTQSQIYMNMYDTKFGILHAGQADASAVTWWWGKIKKMDGHPPPFWLETIYPDPVVYHDKNAKAGELGWYLDNYPKEGKVPTELRDYDPEVVLKSKKTWPCGWCGWKETCLAKGHN